MVENLNIPFSAYRIIKNNGSIESPTAEILATILCRPSCSLDWRDLEISPWGTSRFERYALNQAHERVSILGLENLEQIQIEHVPIHSEGDLDSFIGKSPRTTSLQQEATS